LTDGITPGRADGNAEQCLKQRPGTVIPRAGGVSSTPRRLLSMAVAGVYWIIRRSLSSGGHSADPVADDDMGV